MIFIKYCLECEEAFDIGINYDKCPRCRRKKIKKEDKDYGRTQR